MSDDEKKQEVTLIPIKSRNFELTDPSTTKSDQLEMEFDEVKSSLYDIIQKGKMSLDDLHDFAVSAQHPQVWKAYASLVVAITDTHREINSVIANKRDTLVQLNKTNEKLGDIDEPQKVENHQHLHLSSTEFLQMVKKAKE